MAPPPAKRARTSAKDAEEYAPAVASTSSSAGPSKAEEKKAAAADKAFEKKTKARVKKIFDQCVTYPSA